MNKRTILITGASGLIGTALSEKLSAEGHTVLHLGRKKNPGSRFPSYAWNIESQTIDQEAVDNADVIIHLAGAGIADKRWSESRKKLIISSRTDSAALLELAVSRRKKPLPVFISASGIGYYGMVTSDHVFTESDPAANDFPAACCVAWESSAQKIKSERTVVLRIGVVLSGKGGALQKMAQPVKWLAGSALGSGKQWIPWIHIDDICGIFSHAVQDEKMQGAYNAVAPNPVTNHTLVKLIGKAIRRPVFLPPVPRFILKMLLGEMEGLVTQGSRVSCEKLVQSGYAFQHTNAGEAIQQLMKK